MNYVVMLDDFGTQVELERFEAFAEALEYYRRARRDYTGRWQRVFVFNEDTYDVDLIDGRYRMIDDGLTDDEREA